MSTITEDELARARARNEAVGAAGKRWLDEKHDEIAKLAAGTVVVIDVETGEYVTGASPIEAMDEYDRKIGPERPGFIHEVGRRIFLGGGLFG